jgi:hypothetical protein
VKRFLSQKRIKEADDYQLQMESWVFAIASHFSISPVEVWAMPHDIFQKTLGWVWAVQEERARMRKEQTKGAQSNTETVSLDYSAFFNDEGI